MTQWDGERGVEGMTELERARADLDYAKRKGGFAYKQALAHYRNILRKLR